MDNAIMIIQPYRKHGTWCFSDEATGLVDEPFVAGIPEMIDIMVKDIPNAEKGFIATFSPTFFPDHQHQLHHSRPDAYGAGNYFTFNDTDMEGWLCPAMYKYMKEAPKTIFIKVEELKQ